MKIVIRGKTSFPCDKDWKKRGKKCAGRQARKNTKKLKANEIYGTKAVLE